MTDYIGGDKWSWACGNCGESQNLSGMAGSTPIVNGEKIMRNRILKNGDIIECSECGHKVRLTIETIAEGD